MKKQIYLLFLLLFLTASACWSQVVEEGTQSPEPKEKKTDIGWAVGLKASSLGYSAEVIMQLYPRLHFRLGGSYFNYNLDMTPVEDVVDGTGTVKIGGVNLLANYHFGRVFFLSAGAIYNLTRIDASGISAKPVYVGSVEVAPEDVGRLELTIKPEMVVSPYLGIGVGRVISKNHRVSFAFELGTTYIKQPFADFQTTGMLKPTSSQEQVDQLNDNLSWIYFYPILNFQLGFKIL